MLDIQAIYNQWILDEPKYQKLGNSIFLFIKEGLSEYEMLPEISFRTKELLSLVKKIKKKQKEKPYTYADLTDKLGVRIICPFLSDLDKVDAFLNSNFVIHKCEKKKDKIDFDRLDYQSNHYDASIDVSKVEFSTFLEEKDFVFEIQVRTLNQHAWSNSAHTLFYKQEVDMPDEMKRRIYRLLSIYEIADEEFSLVNKYLQEQPDNFVYTIMRKLEGKIYKYAKIDFDRDTSIDNFRILSHFFSETEQTTISKDIEVFIAENDSKIKSIFDENRIRFFEVPFLTQPEIFLIWYGLEKFEFSITDNWNSYFDEFELETVKSLWGLEIDNI